MEFINTAISKDPDKISTRSAWYDAENTCIVSTNGHSLYMWNLTEGEISMYGLDLFSGVSPIILFPKENKIEKNLADLGHFVNYTRVIPEYPEASPKKELFFTKKTQVNFIRFCVVNQIIIDPLYLMPLTGKIWEYRLSPECTERKAALFLSGKLTSIIMPVLA